MQLDTSGRINEHLRVQVFDMKEDRNSSTDGQLLLPSSGERSRKGLSFSLERGHLRTNLQYRPGNSAKLEVRFGRACFSAYEYVGIWKSWWCIFGCY